MGKYDTLFDTVVAEPDSGKYSALFDEPSSVGEYSALFDEQPPSAPPMSDQGAADLKDKVENTPWYEAIAHLAIQQIQKSLRESRRRGRVGYGVAQFIRGKR